MKNLPQIAVLLLGLIFSVSAQDFMPLPDPYLDSWSFTLTNWESDLGYAPTTYTNIICDESAWSSDDGILNCNGLIVDSTNIAGLTYRTVEAGGHTNLSCTAGTIWFWFSPDWDSVSAGTGGSGPGDWGRFVDVGGYTNNATSQWWSLLVSPDGNTIYFSGQTNGAGTNYLNAPISWTAGSWHLIGLTYTATNSILYIDDQVATNGIGVVYPPGQEALTNGFRIGGDLSGLDQIRGEFVDFETWAYEPGWFDAGYFAGYYDEMLPELPGGFGGGFAMDFGGGVGGFSGGGGSGGSEPGYVDGTNLWLQITGTTNTGTTQTAYFTIWPPTGVTNGIYDLYYTTNLDTDVPGLSGTNWAWVLRCGAGETNLTVTNLTVDNNFFRLGLTNDTDGDGLSDAFEMLVSHTNPTNSDQNTNGIPDGWEWQYFGSLNLSSNADYDGDGNTILYDYRHGFDPNIIQFSLQFSNYYVNTSLVTGTITVLDGMPSYYAVLVNDTNLADANWQSYTSSNIVVTLGSTNGLYNVQVGLRGLATNATPTWLGTQLHLNTLAPVLIITNPVATTVSVPMIQLQGFADESLSSLAFDVSNAVGVVTNQPGYFNPVFYDTNRLEFTTNSFQCYDIALTNGLNLITLHATDLAGNTTTTNVSYAVDYSGDITAPALTLLWPTNGTTIGGSNFTLQAQVDDPTATLTASIVDTNGDTNVVSALVERGGAVWVNGLPLNSGTNVVTLTATDAAGNMSTTNFNVIQSAVGLTIDPLADDQLNQSSVTVTGTVGDPGDSVNVNGVAAYPTDDAGGWEADGVPVSLLGTASLDMEVADSSSNPVGSQRLGQPQPAVISLMSYERHYDDADTLYNYCGEGLVTPDETKKAINWLYASGGVSAGSYVGYDGDCDPASSSYADSLGGGYNGYAPAWEISSTAGNTYFHATPSSFLLPDEHDMDSTSDDVHARVMIVPPGQQAIGQTALYLVQAQVMDEDTGEQLAASAVQFMHQLAGTATEDVTNADGSVWTEAMVSAPAGAQVEVTPLAAGNVSFTGMKLSPSRIVYFSVDPSGMPTSYFNAHAVQTLLQSELSSNVFDSPPTGKFVKVKVVVDPTWNGQLGWSNPKFSQVNRVTWHLTTSDVSYRDDGHDIQINEIKVDNLASTYGTSPTTQTYVNIFAHEGIWGNAGGNHDCLSGCSDGEISAGFLGTSAYLFAPYFVFPSSRTTLRSEFGF